MAVRAKQRMVIEEPNCPYAKKYITKALGYFAAKTAKSLATPSWYVELTQRNAKAISSAAQQATANILKLWMPTVAITSGEKPVSATEVVVPEIPTSVGPETDEQKQDRLHTNLYRLSRACIRCSGQLTNDPPRGPIDCPLVLAVADAAGEGQNYFLDNNT